MHSGLDLELAWDDTTFLDSVATLADIINCHAEMTIRHSAAGKARQLRFERRCAPVPSFLTGTRDVGRAPSQAFSPRPGRLAQELWEVKRREGRQGGKRGRGRTRGGREEGGSRLVAGLRQTSCEDCNLQMWSEQLVRGQPAEASLLGTHRDPPT